MKKNLLLCMLSFVTLVASAQLTYDFNKETGVLTIGGDGTTVTQEGVSNATNKEELKNVVFTATGVTTIGDGAFEYCSSLSSITLPDGLTAIGGGAFSGCSTLTGITLPDGLTAIGEFAFWDCSSLTSITLPDGLTAIGRSAFYGCSSLTSITLPDGLTAIGEFVFYGCSSLTSITLPDGLTAIGEYAFDGCISLTSITVSPQNAYFNSVDGVLFNKQKTVLYCYPIGREATSYIVPESTDSIGEGAFEACSSLSSITCLSETEPTIRNAFSYYDGPSNRTVYVPNATSGFTASNWGENDYTTVTIKYGEYPTSIEESVATSGFGTQIVNGTLGLQIVLNSLRP